MEPPDHRQKVLKFPTYPRPKSGGFSPNYDLWSAGGAVSKLSGDELDPDRKRWIKNW